MLIAQLSDPHLCAPGTLYQDLVDSNAMFAQAIRTLQNLPVVPDVVLLSGDLTEHGTAEEYALARRLLAPIQQPLLLIPGNHDNRDLFRAAFAPHCPFPATGPLNFVAADLGAIRIIGLDVTIPGFHHGDMDDAACDWLESVLAQEPDRPTLIMMHQPPFAIGIGCIDAYGCTHGERLARIVARYPAVERILCGHVHRFAQVRFGGSLALTAPSTTTAIALRLAPNADPASFVEPPAFLLHHWTPNTGMVTHHVPIGDFRGPLPFF